MTAQKLHLPNLTLKPNHACNFHCAGCSTSSPTSRVKTTAEVNPIREYLLDLTESVESIGRISVLGGEPTLVGIPKLNAFIDGCVDILAEGGIDVQQVDLVTNGSTFIKKPLLYTTLTPRVTHVILSVHPELFVQLDNDQASLYSHATLLRQIVQDRPLSLRMTDQFMDLSWSPVRSEDPAPECIYGYANECTALDPDGLHKCDIASPNTQKSSPAAIRNAAQIAQQSAVKAITPDSVSQLLGAPVEACHYCPGSTGRKVPHLPSGMNGQASVLQAAEKVDGSNLDIILPYRCDSPQRKANLIRTVEYLYAVVTNPNILIIESDQGPTIPERIKDYVTSCCIPNTGVFNQAALYNTAMQWTDRDYVLLQDVDILVHPGAIVACDKLVRDDDGIIIVPQNGVHDLDPEVVERYPFPYVVDYSGSVKDTYRFSNEVTGGFYGSRRAFLKTGMFDAAFEGWGYEDLDFIERAKTSGVRVVRTDNYSVHQSHPQSQEHRNQANFDRNYARYERRRLQGATAQGAPDA